LPIAFCIELHIGLEAKIIIATIFFKCVMDLLAFFRFAAHDNGFLKRSPGKQPGFSWE